ncbi:MAG: FCD domain-containing protein [Planctomycetaceae bacterium]|nr:FCD domain-containing protein [Planctomycetaceae bacterium]
MDIEPNMFSEKTESGRFLSKSQDSRNAVLDFFATGGRRSAVDHVIDRFKMLFLQRILNPGDRIPSEKELSDSMNIGRGSIREAVKVLAGYGILEIRRGDGTYVSQNMGTTLFDHLLFQILASGYDQRNLIELRKLMEYGVVDLAITRHTPEDMELLDTAHLSLKGILDSGDYTAEDLINGERRFHLAMSRATHNEPVHRIYSFTLELILPTIRNTFELREKGEQYKVVVGTHTEIVDAIRERNPGKGISAIAHSIDTWIYSMDRFP